ncbi:MAG: FAD-dependent oxidoreductase [Oscillospiraceae bacterium]|jgi:2,4-dienoyl-CoA reductase-like NADH-dependent reductase (Old Yellow Enzyme family)/thioredoxin reductase|nr:FAD-dependent oxidoreductase [Oscillospiraceae bacterium]
MSYTPKYPHLFDTITLAGTTFKSRLFASPTGAAELTQEQFPKAETFAYFERKAKGGAASVCVGDAVVDFERGRANPNHMPLDNPLLRDSFTLLADSITKHGAVASIELSHGGGASKDSAAKGFQIYGVTEFTDSNGNHVLPYTDELLEDVIRKYAEAAAFAKRCGFGMVTVHGGHGWLISQFVSPIHNTRTDKWGGTVENRCRLPIAILTAIRKAVGPAFPIEIRVSGSECHANGYDLDEGIAIAKQLDGYADLIHVSAGDHEVPEVFTVTHPSMFLEDGVNVKYAAEIKKHLTKSKVATVGALSDPELMEEIIASGKADVVEVARGLIADPDLPLKARTGQTRQINKCIRCLTCFSNLMQTGMFVCALNPEIGRELDFKYVTPPRRRKRVLVAGGGIGGMQAAYDLAMQGHQVTLCEASNSLGGVLRCEDEVPFKSHLREYLDRQAQNVYYAGVDVRLNTRVTPEFVEVFAPDALFVAIGAKPLIPPITGIENTLNSVDAYTALDRIGKSVVIIGAGLVGSELALYLAQLGRNVTILEAAETGSNGGNILHALALGYELDKAAIVRHFNTKVTAIAKSATGVVITTGDNGDFSADTVINACGLVPLKAEADELRSLAPQVEVFGDCVTPATIYQATKRARYAAYDL